MTDGKLPEPENVGLIHVYIAAMRFRNTKELKAFLDEKAEQYNRPSFIENDPILIPHRYTKKQDIEIAGFFAAMLAWGQRVTIINKCTELLAAMDNTPHDFIRNHRESDLRRFEGFRHRTFNSTDTLYFIAALQHIYSRYESLEHAFCPEGTSGAEARLVHFHRLFFSLPDYPERTRKHIPTPERKSTCKRLNMFLRWMVRSDTTGVDFGIWKSIRPAELICPFDIHVEKVARYLRLVNRGQTDWLTAVELTDRLKKLDPVDPVRYDFALFGLGLIEGWSKSIYFE